MSLKDTADASAGLALVAGIFMFVAGFVSLMVFLDYMRNGEMAADIVAVPCMAIGVMALVVLMAFNLPLVRVLINAGPTAGRRAAYFQLLFPVTLVSLLVATPGANFVPSITFAFPLLLLGGIAYPYTALQMKKWVKAAEHENLVILRCFRCSYLFEMHKEELWLRCPYCGQVNMNPAMGEARGAPPGEAATEERVSP